MQDADVVVLPRWNPPLALYIVFCTACAYLILRLITDTEMHIAVASGLSGLLTARLLIILRTFRFARRAILIAVSRSADGQFTHDNTQLGAIRRSKAQQQPSVRSTEAR